ncbi:CAZyme family GH25 [Penicillium roqueforti]|uniref:N,O-diacetylmuramidase n=1 Tax=Penicillium roqueforti (strain FM164) TaxID=1365484 RepID=W6QJR8_PENRF|nr:CAZyme family GH25 [Penicillium roqueforti]CDM37063.1 N,O-diacetylmuramidase [Penicillium roqueforti FM164]KAF9239525.1 CAZyme family GH25 [Penicillium roqueforti]KAI1829638.1 CAZyme family GH25 [Penicillium roqueforti]KAI2669994.1 CAZyme family GH25 [Penicillium roqueforti]KAI2671933.1 CAZyme family GH25 [Penicillium roqueforti]
MKFTAIPLLFATAASATVQGFDISSYQPSVDFAGAYKSGARFVMIKATEGTSYTSSTFSSQYTGATNAGLIRGGYHFAQPASSTGATQAKYFIAHGGGWSNDGLTLPGMLDIEYNPSGATCYGLSQSAMVAWVKDFGETYKAAEGRYPMIYSTADWWNTCTGGSTAFSADYPLVLASYSTSVGTIPGGWPYQSFWQNTDSYSYGGDSEVWNGSEAALQTFAKNAS